MLIEQQTELNNNGKLRSGFVKEESDPRRAKVNLIQIKQ